MATTTQWILELVDKITSPMKGVMGASEQAASAVEGVGSKADESGKKLKGMSAIDLYAISDAANSIAEQFNALNRPGAEFNAQLKELEAIAGITGDKLENLGDKGRAAAKEFGGDASAMLESYKGILGKLGPGIAQNDKALELMGRNVATLSKTMKGDAVGAMNALTGSMLQFGNGIEDPMEMAKLMTQQMNIMAAASKEGSAEVPMIAQAIKQAGNAANSAKLSFAETNAVIQALGKGTIYGSEAGVGFRNMLGKMAGIDVIPKGAVAKMQALGINYDIISDKTRPFVERLKELQKAQADATLIAQIFGTENQNAVNTILNNIPVIEDLQGKIVGTTTATDQATVIMSGYNERMGRMKAWLNDVAIGFFDVTSKLTPFVDGLAGSVMVLANMSNATKGVKLLFTTLKTMPVVGGVVSFGGTIITGAFGLMSTAAKGLGTAIMSIPILGWIAAIIAGLIALGVYFWKTSAKFRGALMGTWEFLKAFFIGQLRLIKDVGKAILKILKTVFNPKNWFRDDFSFADAFKEAAGDVVGAAKEYGASMGKAYEEGKQKGMASYYKDHPEEDPSKTTDEDKNKIVADLKAQYATLADKDDVVSEAKKKQLIEALEKAMPGSSADLLIKKVSPVLTPTNLTDPTPMGAGGAKKTSSGLSGSGGGSAIKNISQKIDIKNYFTISAGADKGEFENIAEKIVRALNDKLSDSMVAAGA